MAHFASLLEAPASTLRRAGLFMVPLIAAAFIIA
jgi:hypothetical protein